MSLSWIMLVTFASASLLAMGLGTLAYDRLFRYRDTVRERLDEMSQEGGRDSILLFKDIKRIANQEVDASSTWRELIRQLIDEAGARWSFSSFAARCVGGGLVAASVGFWWSWWLSILMVPLGLCLPVGVLCALRQVRQRKLCRQLPEAFQMISRAVSAGQTVPAALQIIAQDFDPPISEEFALCYEQQNLGMSRESALRRLARRSGIMELQIFVVALLVQAKSGGDLVELLDNLAAMMRKRLKLKDRIRALTGEGRMQAIVLLILPIAALLGVIVLAPDYGQILLERQWILVGTAAAQLLGALWIRQIINFEY